MSESNDDKRCSGTSKRLLDKEYLTRPGRMPCPDCDRLVMPTASGLVPYHFAGLDAPKNLAYQEDRDERRSRRA